LAIEFAVGHGYPAELFLETHWKADSTVSEAMQDIALLRTRSARKVLIVTNVWHTARAGRIFRRLAPDLEIHVVGVSDSPWDHGNWWRNREGEKEFVLEFMKTLADYLHM
jgi:uncharacterized SAM-binding protein YcdF (DUF218 family)